MGLQRFVVENTGDDAKKVGNAMGWQYKADNSRMLFHHVNGYGEVPDDIEVEGDFIGKEVMFLASGFDSKFLGEISKPENPILRALWEKGFARKTRVNYIEIRNAGGFNSLVESKCSDLYPTHALRLEETGVKPVAVYKKSGNGVISLMLATADGKLPNGKYLRLSYVNRYATEEDVEKWKELYENAHRV